MPAHAEKNYRKVRPVDLEKAKCCILVYILPSSHRSYQTQCTRNILLLSLKEATRK